MTTIVTRAGKGSPLTHTEVDTNFTNLNTAKLETAAIPLGTLQAPSVSFLNDSDTGIFCPQGGNSLAIATGGQYAISCTSTQAVGIKTANPQKTLHVAGSTRVGADDATDAFLEIGEGATGNRTSYIDIVADTTYTDYGVRLIRNNTGANATSEIKHRGTGNFNITTQEASAIEFSTSNTPRATIDSSGRLLVGTTTSVDVGGGPAINQLFSAANSNLLALTLGYAVADGPRIQLGHSRNSVYGSRTILENNDELGRINFNGDDGTDLNTTGASIVAYVDGTPGANDMPGRLVFSTTPDGSASPTERMRITSTGQVRLAGAGITFNGDTAAANELDDYEEGTWTPVVTSGSGSITTLGAVSGTYTKIGRLVCANFIVAITTNGTGGTFIAIEVPFTALATQSAVGVHKEVNLTGGLGSVILNGTDSFLLQTSTGLYPGVDGCKLVGTISYPT